MPGKRVDRAPSLLPLAVTPDGKEPDAADKSVWDIRAAADDNYRRALCLLDECAGPGDRTRAIAEIRRHIAFAMQVLETLCAAQETQAFMEEVMQVLDECETGARERIINRLRERRDKRNGGGPAFIRPAPGSDR